MIPTDREWRKADKATHDAIERLRAASPVELPDAYLKLLSFSNGGEGPLPVQPFFLCLDSAEVVAAELRARTLEEFFPGFVIVGSNGGGEFVALDARGTAPWPVVALDMTNIDLEDSVLAIAPDFQAFIELIGLDECRPVIGTR